MSMDDQQVIVSLLAPAETVPSRRARSMLENTVTLAACTGHAWSRASKPKQ
jgi:hypothetical protein